jgi:hypothetical protein
MDYKYHDATPIGEDNTETRRNALYRGREEIQPRSKDPDEMNGMLRYQAPHFAVVGNCNDGYGLGIAPRSGAEANRRTLRTSP